MAVRFFHTSDWHLGQFFYHHSRQYEHEQFLAWLLIQIQEKQPHALLIAGDIFDVINPASSAQKQLYQFLADAHTLAPHMQTLMIAGNHDSGYRIEQVEPLLEKYQAKTVGLIGWNNGELDLDRLIIPIYETTEQDAEQKTPEKKIVAWCIALPFLRPAEITGAHAPDRESAIAYLHQHLIAEVQKRKTPEQAIIFMSHAHMQGGEISDSERSIIGNEEALSTLLFDDIVDYVALGHLHKPQKVGQDHIRYSGSPIPLSFSEINYKHQVLDICIDPTASTKIEIQALHIPRSIQLHRLHGELQQVFEQIAALASEEIAVLEQREYVDIEYYSTTPPPLDLRQQIEKALPKNRYRLVRISRKFLAQENNSETAKISLEPPTPEKLFEHLWQKMGYEQDSTVKQDFLSLLDQAQQQLDLSKPH